MSLSGGSSGRAERRTGSWTGEWSSGRGGAAYSSGRQTSPRETVLSLPLTPVHQSPTHHSLPVQTILEGITYLSSQEQRGWLPVPMTGPSLLIASRGKSGGGSTALRLRASCNRQASMSGWSPGPCNRGSGVHCVGVRAPCGES